MELTSEEEMGRVFGLPSPNRLPCSHRVLGAPENLVFTKIASETKIWPRPVQASFVVSLVQQLLLLADTALSFSGDLLVES